MRGGLVGDAGEISLLREIYEDRDSSAWIGHALDDLVGFATHEPCQIDPRVIRIIDVLRERYADMRRVVSVAEAIGLSASRFQHVFTQQVGVPFRRYRAWCRMRAAISEVVGGSNLTTASPCSGIRRPGPFLTRVSAHVRRARHSELGQDQSRDDATVYCAEADESLAESGFTDLIQAMIFHMSSSDLTIWPKGGIGPTTFSEPLRL